MNSGILNMNEENSTPRSYTKEELKQSFLDGYRMILEKHSRPPVKIEQSKDESSERIITNHVYKCGLCRDSGFNWEIVFVSDVPQMIAIKCRACNGKAVRK